MQFLTLLAGASAQIQIGSNALAPSEPASDAEHRRLISTTYPNVDFSFGVEGNNYLTDASTWEYSYLLNSNNRVTLYFYIYEVFHWPTRGKQFDVKCTFSATANGVPVTKDETILNPIDYGIDAPLAVRLHFHLSLSSLSLSPALIPRSRTPTCRLSAPSAVGGLGYYSVVRCLVQREQHASERSTGSNHQDGEHKGYRDRP